MADMVEGEILPRRGAQTYIALAWSPHLLWAVLILTPARHEALNVHSDLMTCHDTLRLR